MDAATQKISAMTGTPPDNATHVGGTSLWLQEVNERVERTGIDTLGSKAQALGLVGGYERMGVAGGAIGVTLAYFNAQENSTAAQLGARDVASLVEASVYYRRSIGNLTFSARGGGGYGWFSQDRLFVSGTTFEEAQASWTGEFIEAHAGLAYEVKLFGPYYARPEVSVDYLRLHQNGYQEHGPDPAFNLAVDPQNSTQGSAQGLMVLGRQWGKASWFRAELRLGYREVFLGDVGLTTANFVGGSPFTLAGDPEKGGWATVGFSLKSGSEFSYFALEGDADFRKGQRRYDLRVAGRSVF
jgi:predicted ribosomally synthesized peptide with SipW-like signal peptide